MLISCSSQHKMLKHKDISTYQTYAWLPSHAKIERKYDASQLNEAIASAVNEALIKKGYTLNTTDPDLLVFVHKMFDDNKRERKPIAASYKYNRPDTIDQFFNPIYYTNYSKVAKVMGYDTPQVEYTEGTVVIDLIDRNTKTIIWRGVTDDQIKPDNIKDEVRKHIQQIFAKFPKQ